MRLEEYLQIQTLIDDLDLKHTFLSFYDQATLAVKTEVRLEEALKHYKSKLKFDSHIMSDNQRRQTAHTIMLLSKILQYNKKSD